jgi:hypothetical protein
MSKISSIRKLKPAASCSTTNHRARLARASPDTTMNQADIHYWLHEAPDAKIEAAIDAAEQRDDLIAQKRDELIEQRIEAMSDDDIICALQSNIAKYFLTQIREALKERNTMRSYAILSNLVEIWIRSDSQEEAVKWMERLESPNHPCH